MKYDYSKYECPYSHLEKECGHELKSPKGYEGTHSVWCACGFRSPVFYLDPEQLGLKKKGETSTLTNKGAKTAEELFEYVTEHKCYPAYSKAMQIYATQQLAEKEAARKEESEGWDRIQKTLEKHLPIEHIVGKDSSKVITEFLEQVLDELKATKAGGSLYPTDEQILEMVEDFTKDLNASNATKRAVQFGFQEGMFNMLETCKSLPKSDGQRYSESDIREFTRIFVNKTNAKEDFTIKGILQSLQSKEQELKGSEAKDNVISEYLKNISVKKTNP